MREAHFPRSRRTPYSRELSRTRQGVPTLHSQPHTRQHAREEFPDGSVGAQGVAEVLRLREPIRIRESARSAQDDKQSGSG
jgi:hypothetical protein